MFEQTKTTPDKIDNANFFADVVVSQKTKGYVRDMSQQTKTRQLMTRQPRTRQVVTQ